MFITPVPFSTRSRRHLLGFWTQLVLFVLFCSSSSSWIVSACTAYDVRLDECAGLMNFTTFSALFQVDGTFTLEDGNTTSSRRCDYYWTLDLSSSVMRMFINGSSLADDPETTAEGLYRIVVSVGFTEAGIYEIRSSISAYEGYPTNGIEPDDPPRPLFPLPKTITPLVTLKLSEDGRCERVVGTNGGDNDGSSAAASATLLDQMLFSLVSTVGLLSLPWCFRPFCRVRNIVYMYTPQKVWEKSDICGAVDKLCLSRLDSILIIVSN